MDTANQESLSILCAEDCGNAPKKLILRDFNIAYARGDFHFVLEQLVDDIVWNRVGDKTIQGKPAVAEALRSNSDSLPSGLHIATIITHGKTAAVNGMLTFANSKLSFCDVYVFNSAGKQGKIKEITSYVIPI